MSATDGWQVVQRGAKWTLGFETWRLVYARTPSEGWDTIEEVDEDATLYDTKPEAETALAEMKATHAAKQAAQS